MPELLPQPLREPMMDKPYSPACERNREPILDLLRPHFASRQQVLEIGSGTGQHAVHLQPLSSGFKSFYGPGRGANSPLPAPFFSF